MCTRYYDRYDFFSDFFFSLELWLFVVLRAHRKGETTKGKIRRVNNNTGRRIIVICW